MSKIIGLDLGTNSIGWAIRNPQKDGSQIIKKGVVIFPKGVGENQTGEYSKAAERTKNRGTRRFYYRRKQRKTKLLKVLIDNDMCPLSLKGWEKWAVYKKGRKQSYPHEEKFKNWLRLDFDNDGEAEYKNPYQLRKEAIKRKLSPEQVGRALYHICQRRGFKSNRLDKSEESNDTKIHTGDSEKGTSGINETKKLIEEHGSLGAGLASLNSHKERIRNRYTAREDYREEVDIICKVQSLDSKLVDKIIDAIFYQRPLKSQKGNVGPCSFEFKWYYDKKNERWRKTYARRCPKSHPLFEEFRARSFINSIKKRKRGEGKSKFEFLSKEDKQKVYPLFFRVSKPRFDFEDIAKKLDPKRVIYSFNYKDYHSISGCPTISQVKNILGDRWEKLKNENKKNHLDISDKRAGKNEISQEDIWHVLFSFDSERKLKEWAEENLSLNDKEAAKFSTIQLKQDYARLSRKALNKIIPYLREGMIYSYAVFVANIEEVIGKKLWKENKQSIYEAIQKLIKTSNRENKLNYIVNNLISEYLDNPPEVLTSEWIEININNKNWNGTSNNEREKESNYIKKKFSEQIQNSDNSKKFVKIERLDQKIKNFLKEEFEGLNDRDLEKLYHPSDIDIYPDAKTAKDGKRYLGNPDTGNFKNPMALKTLYELKALINYMVKQNIIDEKDKVIIEMARELNSANKRKAIERWNRQREKENEEFKIAIKELFREEYKEELSPSQVAEAVTKFRVWHDQNEHGEEVLDEVMKISNNDIKKYRLWKEQEGICLYTGKTISIADLFNENKFDIEHTLRRSKSFDNSLENLTICDIRYNRDIKKTKLPTDLPNFSEDATINGQYYSAIEPRLYALEEKVEKLNKEINKYKHPWGIETEEQKDRRIQKRHLFYMGRDYWKGKLDRLKAKEFKSSFKNSQLIDTQIVTKYARAYLKTVFDKVYTVKGSAVAEFRKLWGLQDEFAKKERVSHIHHAIDAAVISCLTKDKYDQLANYYHAEEMYMHGQSKIKPFFSLPWENFISDIDDFEKDVLVIHKGDDTTLKQTKRKRRKGGKVQYKKDSKGNFILDKNENKIPEYEQGLGIRGQLHLDTFYGAIKRLERDKEGNIKTDEDGNPQKTIKYVVRRPLEYGDEGFKTENQLKVIVDPAVKQKVLDHVGDSRFKSFKNALNHPIWMNKEKGIQIKKVRCYAKDVKNPIRVKEQSHKSEGKQKDYKEFFYAKNANNHAVAVYQKRKNNKFKRTTQAIGLFEVAEALQDGMTEDLYPKELKGIPFFCELKHGDSVFFYENDPDEISYNDYSELCKRLYNVTEIEKDGRIKFKFHSDSRSDDELRENFKQQYGKGYDKTLVKGKSQFELDKCFPKLRISPTNLNIVPVTVENLRITPTGEIERTPKNLEI